VSVTSLVTPRLVGDIVIATGEMIVRKQQIVLGGYDARQFATGRLWVTASDGVRIPVSVVARADLVEMGIDGELRALAPSPFVLYGYGSYEISIDPSFSSLRLSLLERGVIFAIAHVRAVARWVAPGTRRENWPRSPRPSATSSRSREI